MYENLRGPDHPDVADTLHNLGNVLAEVDQNDEALAAYERALVILQKERDDPSLASLLYDYGDLLIRKPDHAKAEQFLQRSLAIGTKARADSPNLSYPLTALGELYTTKRPREAVPLLERALVLCKDESIPPEEQARTEFAMAKLLWPSPATRLRARELARTAVRHLEHAEAHRKDHQAVTQWLKSHE